MRPVICHLIAFAAMSATVGPVTFLLSDNVVPFERTSGRMIPENPLVGDYVSVEWDGKRNRWCEGTVRRKIVDSHKVEFTVEESPVTQGNPARPNELLKTFRLPANMAPGPAVYHATIVFRCNPLHRYWPITTYGSPVIFNAITPTPAAPQPGAPGAPGARGEKGEKGDAGTGCSGEGEGRVCREQ